MSGCANSELYKHTRLYVFKFQCGTGLLQSTEHSTERTILSACYGVLLICRKQHHTFQGVKESETLKVHLDKENTYTSITKIEKEHTCKHKTPSVSLFLLKCLLSADWIGNGGTLTLSCMHVVCCIEHQLFCSALITHIHPTTC